MEVEFQQREYSPEEGDGSVTVCAEMNGRTDREVSVLFSTRLSQEGALGKNIAYGSICERKPTQYVVYSRYNIQARSCYNIIIKEYY